MDDRGSWLSEGAFRAIVSPLNEASTAWAIRHLREWMANYLKELERLSDLKNTRV